MLLAWTLVALPIASSPARAQPTQPPIGPGELDDLPPGFLPDAVYYQNENRELVRLLLDRVKEFENFLRTKNDPAPNLSPAFRLEDTSLELALEGRLVRLKGALSGELEEEAEKWFEIPIAFSNIQILPSEQRSVSRVIPATAGGYVWRHGPVQSGRLTHSFEAVTSITPSADGGSVRLDLPNSPSRILVPLSPNDWEISVSGSGGEVVEPRLEEKSFLIRVPGGASVISWTRKAATDNAQSTEVTSQLRVSVDSAKNDYSVNCRMTIRGPRRLGGRSFTVELPEDSVWKNRLSSTALLTGYRLIPSVDSPRVQTIEIDESIVQSEFEVSLEWTGRLPADTFALAISLPKVSDVTRHSGNITLSLSRAQSLVWEPQEGILFTRTAVSADPTEVLANNFFLPDDSLVLRCQIAKEQTLPAIRADHRVQILADRVFLTTIVEFKEDVRNLPFLQWEGKGWSLVNAVVLSNGKQLNGNQQTKPGDDIVILPLPIADLNETPESPAVPPIADTSVSRRVLVQCVHSLPASDFASIENSGKLSELDLNVPVLSWLDEVTQTRRLWSPAGVVRFESSIFQLQNRGSDAEGENAVSVSGTASLLDSIANDSRLLSLSRLPSRSSLNAMNRGEQSQKQWKLNLKLLPPELESNETIRIMAGRGTQGFEQEWLLKSKGAFPGHLLLALPKRLLPSLEQFAEEVTNESPSEAPRSAFDLTFNGTPLTEWTPLGDEEIARLNFRLPMCKPDHNWVRLTIPEFLRSQVSQDTPSLLSLRRMEDGLVDSNTSSSSLQIDYGFALLESGVNQSHLQQLSCVCLVLSEPDTRLVVEDIAFSKSIAEIRIGNDIWKQTRLDIPFDSVRLQGVLVKQDPRATSNVELEKAWVQSVVQREGVRHRIVLRVDATEPTIRLRSQVSLPAETEVSVNGARATWTFTSDENKEMIISRGLIADSNFGIRTAIGTESDEIDSATVIELFIWEKNTAGFWHVLGLPSIEIEGGGELSTPVLWQILTPSTQHLLASSETLAPQNHWSWSRFLFSRQDPRSQSEIESWIGASKQPDLDLQLAQYSVMAINPMHDRWVCLVPAYVVWFPVGLVTLCFTSLVYSNAWLRSPFALMCYLIMLVGMSFWWLEGTILLSQVALLTGVFAVAAMIISWVLDRSSRRRTVLAGRGTTVGTLQYRSSGKSDSKVNIRQEGPVNPIDTLPTTISPSNDIVRESNDSTELRMREDGRRQGGSSVKGPLR
ncbi:hypothetical protein SH449x_005175 [Pirellulaceae bacterium SH449]